MENTESWRPFEEVAAEVDGPWDADLEFITVRLPRAGVDRRGQRYTPRPAPARNVTLEEQLAEVAEAFPGEVMHWRDILALMPEPPVLGAHGGHPLAGQLRAGGWVTVGKPGNWRAPCRAT